jgi:hypothetical protein
LAIRLRKCLISKDGGWGGIRTLGSNGASRNGLLSSTLRMSTTFILLGVIVNAIVSAWLR